MGGFDEIFCQVILVRHFYETFLGDILMRHFDDILMIIFLLYIWIRHFVEKLDKTFRWDILMRHFDKAFWWEIWIRNFDDTFRWQILWNNIMRHLDGWKFIPNMTRLVIHCDKLRPYSTGAVWRAALSGLEGFGNFGRLHYRIQEGEHLPCEG